MVHGTNTKYFVLPHYDYYYYYYYYGSDCIEWSNKNTNEVQTLQLRSDNQAARSQCKRKPVAIIKIENRLTKWCRSKG